MARELYGSRLDRIGERTVGQLGFIFGCGPSLVKAEKYLSHPTPHSFRIAINRAIEKIPAEYWFWIDGDAYLASKEHPNARSAIQLGVDRFSNLYDDSVHVWERVFRVPEDIYALKLVHRATSLIAAIHMASLLGAARIVTVGTDHQITQAELDERKRREPGKNWEEIYRFTFSRIVDGISKMPMFLPHWVTVADASGGALPLPKTYIGKELSDLEHYWIEVAHGEPVPA